MASIESKLAKAAKSGTKGDTGTALRSSYIVDADASVPDITVAGSPIADIAGDYNLNVTEQGLTQVDPNAAVNESEQFINTFNAIQAANNAAIGDVTHRQGTDIPAQTGGLHGTDYWTNLYQTKQVNSQIANLRAATQQQALNDVMNNLKDIEAEKLNQNQRRLTALRAKFIPSFYDYTPNINQYTYDPKAAKKAKAAAAAAATQKAAQQSTSTPKVVTDKTGTKAQQETLSLVRWLKNLGSKTQTGSAAKIDTRVDPVDRSLASDANASYKTAPKSLYSGSLTNNGITK